MATSAVYDYMYNVLRGGDGSFTVEAGAPAATTVDFKSNQNLTSFTPGRELHISSAGNGLNGAYDYIGSVTTSEGGTGYVLYNPVSQQYYMITDTKFTFGSSDYSLGHADSTDPTASELPICLLEGTQVATPEGEAAIETLKAGDLVVTADGHAQTVRWIGRQTVTGIFADELSFPVRIKAGALGENMPSRDLLVSHGHAVFVDGILVQAGALINGVSVVRELDMPKSFIYYHIELDDHALVLAENTPVETFVDNVDRARFDNWSEYESLYPYGKSVPEMAYPRAKAMRQVPMALRSRLNERAMTLCGGDAQSAA